MPNREFSGIDFVRELRLRQWARQHYVMMENRKPTWHPVVLDEMARRDRELLDDFARRVGEIVVPAQVCTTETSTVESPVTDSIAEKLAVRDVAVEQLDLLDWQQPGAAYVPLAPSGDWRLHAAEVNPPKPHFAAQLLDRPELAYTSDLTAMT